MKPVYMFLLLAIFGAVMTVVASLLKKKRAGSEKYQQMLTEFRQQAEAMLENGEVIEALCGYNPCAAVTGKRLLVGGKKGIDSVAFSEIRKLKGMDMMGNSVRDVSRMQLLQIKAEKNYTLGNHSEGFEAVAQKLKDQTGL